MKIITRYHLPTRGTPEIVQVRASDLHALLCQSLAALERAFPQIQGVLVIQDAAEAIRALKAALADMRDATTEQRVGHGPDRPKGES